jgi:hypothetical protein
MRRVELAPNTNDPVVEQREQAAAHVVKVLENVRAELARAEALLERLSRERPGGGRPLTEPTRHSLRIRNKLAETLFDRSSDA